MRHTYADKRPCWESKDYIVKFDKKEWNSKKNIAVFRGSTGCGTTLNTNQRLKIIQLGNQYPDKIDAKITYWNIRPRFNNGTLCKFITDGLRPKYQEVIVTLPLEQNVEQRLVRSKHLTLKSMKINPFNLKAL